jgi:hypothetical protein
MYQNYPAFKTHDPAINNLRRKIREGLEADNPSLISLWLTMEEVEFAKKRELRWSLYLAQFKLLLETFADDLIVGHWRAICLDNIYKPLSGLQRLAFNQPQHDQIRLLQHELRATSHFFQYAIK